LVTASPHSKRYISLAAAVSTLGGFLFGYDTIVISGAIGYLSIHFHLDPIGIGWAASSALVGCVVGSAGAGAVADRIGQKRASLLCAICFAVSSIGVSSAVDLTQFSAWRIIAGFGIGAASIVSPLYISEVSPTRFRGRLVALYQLGIVVGALAAVIINMAIQKMGDEAWNAAVGWRWMLFAGIVPAVLFGILIIPSVESPRWLMKMGKREDAIDVLTKLNGADSAMQEARDIEESLTLETGRFSELFGSFRRPLLLGIMLAGLSQISGIEPLWSFLPEVFHLAGTNRSDAFMQTVLVSLVNLVFTIVGLCLVDKAGRKKLIVIGTLLQFLSFAFVGFFYHVHASGRLVLVFIMIFIAGHAFGNGVACWVIISEVYPTKVRGRGMSIAITALWVIGFAGNQCFPSMQSRLGTDGTFWCFSAGALLNLLAVLLFVPETKGRSLEEITKIWTT
jgi:SP family arabinose:H+ symporter-like MFS transporter